MKQNSYVCDNCGKSREKDANHWFVLTAQYAIPGAPTLLKWNQGSAEDPRARHACGQECAFAMLARFMATGTFERVAVKREDPCPSSA